MKRSFPWVLTLVVIPALCLLIGLGVWQVQRMQWKTALITEADRATQSAPVPLNPPIPPQASPDVGPDVPSTAAPAAAPQPRPPEPPREFPEFQRVIIWCDWATKSFVELRAIRDGVPGVRLISRCDNFLVDRGFLPDGVTQRPSFKMYRTLAPPGRETPIIAQARTTPRPGPFAIPPSERTFYVRDNRKIAEALGGDPDYVAKQVLFAEQSTAPDVPELIAEPPPPVFSNNHLGYAITWFGLALALVGFYVALLRRHLGKPNS